VLGAASGRAIGVPGAAGLVAALNGAIGGWQRVYRWSSPRGVAAFALDSTWALATTTASLAAHAVAAAQRTPGNFVSELSERRDRHVYARGLTVRPRHLFTVGNVVNGAGFDARRARSVVERHEDVHVWQARWLGPVFPVLYGAWMVVGAAVGVGCWLWRRQGSAWATLDAWAYYRNPFEWWAYSREGRWPPPHLPPGAVWRRPLTRPSAHRAR
jgi:hypothetical protein